LKNTAEIIATGTHRRLASLTSDERVRMLREVFPPQAELYIVGGAVRDALLGAPSEDLDFATDLGAEEVMMYLSARGIRTVPTGMRHGTVTAVLPSGGAGLEITSYRGAAPGGLAEDLCLRDFTINALALHIESGELIDPVGGLNDLASRVVRAPGSAAARFQEDPLRMLRMVRFGCGEGFTVAPETKRAASALSAEISKVSVERVRDEFSRILLSPRPDFGLCLMHELGLLGQIAPEIAACCGFEQNRFHHLDLFAHTAAVVAEIKPDLILRLAALLHDVGKPATLSVGDDGERHFYCHEVAGMEIARKMLTRLRYPHGVIDAALVLVRTHMRPLDCGPSGMRRLLRDTGEQFERWRELKRADSLCLLSDRDQIQLQLEQFDAAVERLRQGPDLSPLGSLAINGDDLIGLGLKPGPLFGRILRALHEAVLDQPELNQREELLRRAQELAGAEQ